MAAIFKMAAMRPLPVFFLFIFHHSPCSWTEKNNIDIGLSECTFRILTWNMGHLLCLCTIFACWPQIVNFISPNYAQSSGFVQTKFIGSLAVWLPWAYFLLFLFRNISFSLLTFFLPNFKSMHSALCPSALVDPSKHSHISCCYGEALTTLKPSRSEVVQWLSPRAHVQQDELYA